MRDVKLKNGLSDELEAVLPVDRVVTIDGNNTVYLYDGCFVIDEKDIEGEV